MSKSQVALNQEIRQFVADKVANDGVWSLDDVKYAQQYAGAGGLEKGMRGMLYEYYTPDFIIERMWGLVANYGFTGGNILEPSVGTGRFLNYVDPTNSFVDAFEFSKDDDTSYQICKATYPFAHIKADYFETIFYSGNQRVGHAEEYDLVIGNPPYGKFSGPYAGATREKKHYKGGNYAEYFMWASLQVMKPGALLCMIIPQGFLAGKTRTSKGKWQIMKQAELVDAYRLPLNVFDFTGIGTDIIVLRKK